MWFHHVSKRILWSTREEDTFPVKYLMNSRSRLKTVFVGAGFREVYFRYLDDCRTLARWKATLGRRAYRLECAPLGGATLSRNLPEGVYERT